jgi:hypothetical protein
MRTASHENMAGDDVSALFAQGQEEEVALSTSPVATSSPLLLALPWHVMQHHILARLDNRSLVAFACTCSAARDAVRQSLTPAHRAARSSDTLARLATNPHLSPSSLTFAQRTVGPWALILATHNLVTACAEAERALGGCVALAATHSDGGCRRLLFKVLLPALVAKGGDPLILACVLACHAAASPALIRAAVCAGRAVEEGKQGGGHGGEAEESGAARPRRGRRAAAKSRTIAPRAGRRQPSAATSAQDGEEMWHHREAAVLALYIVYREHEDARALPLPLPLPLPPDPIDVDMLRCVAAATAGRTGWLLRLLPEAPLFKLGDVTNSAALATAMALGRLDVLRAVLAAHRLTPHDVRTLCYPGLQRACAGGHLDVVTWLVEEWDLGPLELEQAHALLAASRGGHVELVQLLSVVAGRR